MCEFKNYVKWMQLESCAKKFTKPWVNQNSYYDILDYFRNRNFI